MARKSTDLVVNILGDYDSLKKTLRKASGDLGKFDKTTKQVGKGTGFRNIGKAALGAAAGIGAVTIAANEVKKSVTGTVELAKATRQLQRATGLASEDASQLAAVLKVRGLSTDKVGRSFTTLARQIEAAKKGTGGAADAFRQLGVSQKAIQSGNFNQVLLGISDGYKKLGDGTAKASVAQQLFGRNSRDLLPLLEGGSKKLREQLALAPALSDAQVKQSLAMVNAQRQVDLALMNVRTTLGTTLMPVLADGANKLAKFVTEMKTGKGAGGEFAKKAKEIFNAIKPALEKLVDFGKAVFNFAANNPEVVKIAANLAAVGLAIKAIKFGSSISGLSTFIKTAKGLGGPLRKLFSKFGARAGAEFATEAAASTAGSKGLGGALAPSGTLGKMGDKKNGKFAKWGRRMGIAARLGLIAALTYELVPAISAAISEAVPGSKKFSANGRKVGDNSWLIFDKESWANLFNTIIPFGDPVGTGRPRGRRGGRGGPGAKGSSVMGRGSRALSPSLNPYKGSIYDLRGMDPLTGGIPVEALLQRAQGKQASAQYAVDRYQASIGDSRSKAETKRLRELTAAAREAQRQVDKLQKQLSRRDALLEIRSQFKDFTQGFTDAYAQGLQNIADARLQAAQNIAQKTLDAQLKALDEEEGQSEEAKRLRELRNQQETDAKTREDEDYAKNKLAIETDLARAIRNGNLKGQQELQQQLNDLEQTRRETLRTREIQDLSESLARQRRTAQDEYEAKTTAAQTYYDEQVERNKQAVADYKKVIEEQMTLLTGQLEAGKISYADFTTRVNELNGWLTGMFRGDLENRATAEITSLGESLGRYGTYVDDINAEFARVMRTLPPPQIPPIPQISVDTVLNITEIKYAPGVTPPGTSTGGGGGLSGELSIKQMQDFFRDHRGGKYKLSYLATIFRRTTTNLKTLLTGALAPDVARNKIKIDYTRVSGGRLSRSGLTMVGETGPELIANGEVYSATRTARMGSAGGVTLNVYPRTTADDPTELARALGWQLTTR